jgi:hypothetical protein
VVAHDRDILISQIPAQDPLEPCPVLRRQLDLDRGDVLAACRDEREVRPVKPSTAVALSADYR